MHSLIVRYWTNPLKYSLFVHVAPSSGWFSNKKQDFIPASYLHAWHFENHSCMTQVAQLRARKAKRVVLYNPYDQFINGWNGKSSRTSYKWVLKMTKEDAKNRGAKDFWCDDCLFSANVVRHRCVSGVLYPWVRGYRDTKPIMRNDIIKTCRINRLLLA